MADAKLSALTELAATPATDDELYIRDVSELAVDESKRITVANLVAAGAPTGADYLVGTTQAGLSAEIVVGAAPGGELGGTWASPTVDSTHSGSAHHAAYTHPNHSGDVTSVADGAQTIANAAVTLAKMADIATARFIGRTTALTGVPEALTAAQATALLDAATATVKGLVPTPPNNTTTFLRGDATFAAPGGGGALTRVGGNTTEATTTSLTEVSLITISSLSVGALVPILALGIWRKTDGAAASVSVGLMLNATAGYMSAISDAVDIVRNGAFEFYVGSRQTNYARPGWRLRNMAGTSDLVGVADDVPLVTITDVIIRGLTGSASVTLAVDEIHVYTYAVS